MALPALPSWWKVAAFTICLLFGLVGAQVLGAFLDKQAYHDYAEIVMFLTMWALSYIMVHVGYEFTIDKNDLKEYGIDYLIAMTAAGFPWVFVAVWFLLTMTDLPFDEAFLVARFAAPTSAGILFSMLEGAGLRDTWVFQKARILAIFDDLDTIILMIPLKMVMVGFKWELLVTVAIMIVLLAVAWFKLHAVKLPHSCWWTLFYGLIVAVFCKALHYVTHHSYELTDDAVHMKPIHIEVLLPAFVIGCIIDTPCARAELAFQRKVSFERKKTILDLKALKEGKIEGEKSASSITASGAMTSCSKPELVGPCDKGSAVKAPANSICYDKSDAEAQVPTMSTTCYDKSEPPDADDGDLVRSITQTSGQTKKSEQSLNLIELNLKRQITGSSAASVKSRLSRYGLDLPSEDEHHGSELEQNVQVTVSMVFMVLVGLSMPALIGKNAKNEGDLEPGFIAFHVVVVSILMILGKMFPIFCYRDEAPLSHRLALCLGMCPRGEVGASIIVISLELGVSGPAVIISMLCLVINLVFSGAFIGMVKILLRKPAVSDGIGDNVSPPAPSLESGENKIFYQEPPSLEAKVEEPMRTKSGHHFLTYV